MKQVIQTIREGKLLVQDVPAPLCARDRVLVLTQASLVSAGTERMVVEFSEKSLVEKARSRPDLVREVLNKAKREGILTTVDAVMNRLAQPIALGYSSAGVVLDVGAGVEGVRPGDRVACAGGGFAVHAGIASMPRNLVIPIGENVSFEAAAFGTIGAIALQGIRLADVKLGEVVGVIGLGLIGQLAVQLLVAAGAQVVGLDLQSDRAALASRFGAISATTDRDAFVSSLRSLSLGHGADAVVIAADAKGSEALELAGEASRDKGVVVAVGAVGMTIPRKIYYEKEIDFRISRSYGPGRYDPQYEEKGIDYPYAYVRWTEQRNIQAFVDLVSAGRIDVESLISHRFEIEHGEKAYDLITGKTGEKYLGVVLTYASQADSGHTLALESHRKALPKSQETIRVGVIGAGNYANASLLPVMAKIPEIQLVGIASGGGLNARLAGDRFGFRYASTDSAKIIEDPDVDTIVVLTRHNSHAGHTLASIAAGKNVFVEKPLCLTLEDLETIEKAHGEAAAAGSGRMLMVGYNRRFAGFFRELKGAIEKINEPLILNYRVNAGFIPAGHWTQDPIEGGGRLLGEGCHFIDALIALAGSQPKRVTTRVLPDTGRYRRDNFTISIEFENGSLGTITYASNGDKGFGKELIEVFGGGLSARLDDFRTLNISRGSHRTSRRALLRQDKGHKAEWEAIARHLVAGDPPPISEAEIFMSTRAALAAHASLVRGEAVPVS